MISIGLALGSNSGNKQATLRCCLDVLESACFRITRISPFYKTAPWGKTDQDWFVNCCLLAETSLKPFELLDYCQNIERSLGRVATTRWGPRVIDIDVLFYGDLNLTSERLTLPHAEMGNRVFVLAPLADIAPDFLLDGRKVVDVLSSMPRFLDDAERL